MSSRRMLLIGIDGLDPLLLERFKQELPQFKKMMEKSSCAAVASTFPPDSVCAWSSIYTGLNPAQHGIVGSIDYLDANRFRGFSIEQGAFQGKTFWDALGAMGKKVVIINPFLAYPAWQVNGIMVSGPVFEGGDVSVYPQNLSTAAVPEMGGIIDFPDKKDLAGFASRVSRNTRDIHAFSMGLLASNPWDFAFVCFLTLDRIQHFFWRYHDRCDPTHPVNNEFQDVIRDFYRQFDSLIGTYMQSFPEADLVVLSDHGHGRRCTRCFNVNEFLRQKGYLEPKGTRPVHVAGMLAEKIKNQALRLVDALDIHDIAFKLARHVPGKSSLKKSSYIIDKNKSLCYAADTFGTNPSGGIAIRGGLSQTDYAILRDKVIFDLKMLNDTSGIFKWIKKREDIYTGEFLDKYPDIVFQLQDEYGVSWSIYSGLFSTNPTHKKISGGHRDQAVFLAYPPRDLKKAASVINVKEYIVDFFR